MLLNDSTFCLFALTLQLALQVPSASAADDELQSGFRNPPPEARPMVWWHWINGNVTKEGIRADLEDMKRVGIGGAQILDVEIYLPPGPVRYGSDPWHEHVQYAGQDPTVPNASIGTLTATSLSFTKRLDASGLTYAIQQSTDLGISDNWEEVSGPNYVNDPNTISYSYTPGTPAKNFLRLQVVD